MTNSKKALRAWLRAMNRASLTFDLVGPQVPRLVFRDKRPVRILTDSEAASQDWHNIRQDFDRAVIRAQAEVENTWRAC